MADALRFRFEALNEHHFIQGFRCCDGEDDGITEYLHEHALQDMAKGEARTHVLIDNSSPTDETRLAGFFTLRADALTVRSDVFEDDWDVEDTWGNKTGINVPLVELMYIARDCRWRRQSEDDISIGDVLMIQAVRQVARASEIIGLIGLHLRSTDAGLNLYSRFDFRPFVEHPQYDKKRFMLPIGMIRDIDASLPPDT